MTDTQLLKPEKPSHPEVDLIAFDADQTIITGHLHHACCTHLKNHPDLGQYFELVSLENGRDIVQVKRQYAESENALWDQLYAEVASNGSNHIHPTGAQLTWQKIFSELIAHNFNIAIVSYTYFQPALIRFLKDPIFGLGLTDEIIKKIVVITGLPEKEGSKESHIIEARVALKLSQVEDMSRTILIDDSQNNINSHQMTGGMGLFLPIREQEQNPEKIRKFLEEKKFLFEINIPFKAH